MLERLSLPLTAVLIVLAGSVAAEVPGDVQRGQQVFKKCASCHMLGPEAHSRVGPPLNNILSARAGSVAGFRYSKAMAKAAAEGLHWSPAKLDEFLRAPREVIPKTKMSFRGLKSEADRIDVIAYLATFSGGSMAEKVDEGFTVPAQILALEGDVEYGEYLSSECTTCHRADGDNDGIPSIVGWQTEAFVTAMYAYKEKRRENPVMQMITGRLASEEIAALAAYFEGLKN